MNKMKIFNLTHLLIYFSNPETTVLQNPELRFSEERNSSSGNKRLFLQHENHVCSFLFVPLKYSRLQLLTNKPLTGITKSIIKSATKFC